MKKVIVIGCPGAGKSTFARKLRDITRLPLYYLDMLWHRQDKSTAPKEIFDAEIEGLLQKNNWIIDGNYLRTLEMRMRACDTVFLLDFPVEDCLLGAQSRIGKKREDLPWVENEFDEEFRQWIIDFPKDQLPEIYHLTDKYCDNKSIIIFKSREEVDMYLQEIVDTKGNIELLC